MFQIEITGKSFHKSALELPHIELQKLSQIGLSGLARRLQQAKFLGKITADTASPIRVKVTPNGVIFSFNRMLQKYIQEGVRKEMAKYIQEAFSGRKINTPSELLGVRWGREGVMVGGEKLDKVLEKMVSDVAENEMALEVAKYWEEKLTEGT
jgi:hypothetical protein